MRILLLAGASLLTLTTPAFAQEGEDLSTTESTSTPIDSLVDSEAEAAPAAPASTGDAVLDRLNALEARVLQAARRDGCGRSGVSRAQGRLRLQ